ncbi:glycoside hydrolase [Dinoroseobacter phage vB_DshS-R5C]|uniref:GTA-like protein n=1 Tax=Dinoroseobacter phage vB_DshS-R5C TaxID=1965368 RepID=A0A1V0DYB0_9CAUD|nr:glycoside hydrolase [Dinoroseobacter phage vB_DshS-R5C]ARB06118.1 GTA-like protein [Dinoroseobacter phage vB_DshS-R5C]
MVILRSGFERRNSIWANARRKYDAGLGIRNVNDLYEAYEFFEGREGRLYGFRWKDWLDYKSCKPNEMISDTDQNIGTGDGSTTVFQLKKAYVSGSSTISRDVTKPVDGTVVVAVNGTPTAVTVDLTNGEVTFSSAPAGGAAITAGFEFDVPVRFDQDEFMVNLEHFDAGAVPDLKVIEIRV